MMINGLLVASLGWSQTLEGRFEFTSRVPREALVYFADDHSVSPQERVEVDQVNKHFTEKVIVGAKGSKILFKNSDEVQHNIFALNDKHNVNINLGLADPGQEKQEILSWPNESFVKISCIIHPRMRTWVASLESRYYKVLSFHKKQKEVNFQIANVPPEVIRLKVWMYNFLPIDLEIRPGESKEANVATSKKVYGKLFLKRN